MKIKAIGLLAAVALTAVLGASPGHAAGTPGECVFVPEKPVKACAWVHTSGGLSYGSGYIRWATGGAPTTLDLWLEQNDAGQWTRITYGTSMEPGYRAIDVQTESVAGPAAGKRACIAYAFNHNPVSTVKCSVNS